MSLGLGVYIVDVQCSCASIDETRSIGWVYRMQILAKEVGI